MHLKDHYKTLELEPSASLQEIKSAYRKLAMQFHPDIKNDDAYSAARFSEIKEAYETLTNPPKRYEYLQQRWYNRAMGNNKSSQLVTPVNILKQSLEFERYTAMLDQYRMDQQQLFEYIDVLLSDDTMTKLQLFDEAGTKQQIAATFIKPIGMIKYSSALQLKSRLQVLASGHQQTLTSIDNALKNLLQKERWERYKWIVVLLATAAICVAIWALS